MGSPEYWPLQSLEHPGSLSPLPVQVRPPTPGSACVSPQDIFSPITVFDDDSAHEECLPPSPLSTGSQRITSSPSTAYTNSIGLLSTSSLTLDYLPAATQSLANLSLDSSPTSNKRKRPSEDRERLLLTRTPPPTRRRLTPSSAAESDEDSDEETVRRAPAKSSTQRRRKPERRVVCDGCQQDFGRRAELTRHQKNSCPVLANVGDKSPVGKKYECDRCGKPLSRSDALRRHESAGEGACRKWLATLRKSKACA